MFVIKGKTRAAFYLITVGDKVVYAVLDIEVMAEKIADTASPPNEDKAVMPIGDIAVLRKGIQTTNSQSRSNSR